MAITVIGGLITSTALTLVVVPGAYRVLDNGLSKVVPQAWFGREPPYPGECPIGATDLPKGR